MMYCEHCGRPLTRKGEDGKIKLRVPILVFEGNRCVTNCPGCKQETPVPIKLALKSSEPRLILRPAKAT